jgi:hypothetical protein
MNQAVTSTQAPRKDLFNPRIVRIIELSFAAILSLTWIVYHIRFFLHAGGLWRDEVNSVNLCTSPTLGAMWQNLQCDSFPILWHLLLRAWIRVGIGSSDTGLRVLGLVTGLAILAVLWVNARRFRVSTPIAALTLLGFTSAFICFGDSIRGYGLGVLLELLTIGLMWNVTVRPTPIRVATALAVALAAVHVSFYDSVILAAVCAGALVVSASHRHWKRGAVTAGIGAVSAASTLIYLPVIHRRDVFGMFFLHESSTNWLWRQFINAIGFDAANFATALPSIPYMWGFGLAGAIVVALLSFVVDHKFQHDSFRRDVVVYHLTILCVGIVGYWWFLARLGYLMQPWYFLALLALVATCLDGLFAAGSHLGIRIALCLASCRFCLFAAQPVWFDAGLRRSNIPQASALLQSLSHPGDLVILSPWNLAISFQRYYHGPASVACVPPLGLPPYQNYALLIPMVQNPHAMDPLITKANDTLRSGHIVFVVGDFGPWSPDRAYPMANNSFRWDEGKYDDLWQRQLAFASKRHAELCTPLDDQRDDVSVYERPQAMAMSGWIDPGPPAAK